MGHGGGDTHHTVVPTMWRSVAVPARKYPKATACGVMLFSLLLGIISVAIDGFDDGGAGSGRFTAIVTETTRYDIFLTVEKEIQEDPTPAPERTQSGLRTFFMYVHTEDGNIFSQDSIERISKFEDKIVAADGYDQFCLLDNAGDTDCTASPYLSIVGKTSNSDGSIMSGTDLSDAIKALDGSPIFDFFFSNDAKLNSGSTDAPFATFTRSFLSFGMPLKKHNGDYPIVDNYVNQFDRLDEQQEALGSWALASLEFDKEGTDLGNGVFAYHFVPWLSSQELGEYISQDISLVVVAALGVVVVMAMQMQSNFLAFTGLVMILSSLPAAFFLYTTIFRLRLFPTLNMLTIFLVLALGADNCFVLHAFWLNSAHDVKDEKDRVAYVIWRGGSAIFTTNGTTFAAFCSTGISSIPAMSSFGWFAACTVFMNAAIGVPLVFPSLLLIWERSYRKKNCVGKVPGLCSLCKYTAPEEDDGKAGADHVIQPDEHGCVIHGTIGERKGLDRWFYGSYANFIERFKWLLIAIFGAVVIIFGVLATQLKPPDNFDFQLPEESAFNGFVSRADEFRASDEDTLNQVHFLFPGSDLDITRTHDLNDVINLGDIVYPSGFKIATATQQEAIVELCDGIDALAGPKGMIYGDTVKCSLRDFKTWADAEAGKTFPAPKDDFATDFKEFLNTADGSDYIEDALFVDGDLISLFISVDSSVALDTPVGDTEDEEVKWVDIAEKLKSSATGKNIPFFQTSLMWVNLKTTTQLQAAALQSVGVSLVLAFVVLFVVTNNLILSVIAGSVVAFIVISVLGLFFAIGKSFDVIISICVRMLAGLSIDYALHYAVGFLESPATSRFGRMRSSLSELGASILGGAITTLASSSLLLAASFEFFKVFGTAVFLSILLAFIFSNLLLMPMLAAFGPVGTDRYGNEYGSFTAIGVWIRVQIQGEEAVIGKKGGKVSPEAIPHVTDTAGDATTTNAQQMDEVIGDGDKNSA